ncbi:MAG: HD domain-containing protein [Clostridiaceae bacterium]|nr:HD domain-containing protein [Clostridiaceae bacterium]
MPRLDKTRISMYDLLICLTDASDLISHEVAYHHQQVAYLAYRIAVHMDLPVEQQKNLMLAGLLHDVGAFSLEERLSLTEEETPNSNDHAFRGARLLEGFSPLSSAAEIIRYHHVPWMDGEGSRFAGKEVPFLSHVLHLADRIAVSINRNENVIDQIGAIRDKISSQRNAIFPSEPLDAFLEISGREYIWLDMTYKPLMYLLPEIMTFDVVELDLDQMIDLTHIFANIIDFRNPFTAKHSAGVARTAEKLAALAGFSENECKMMLIAGYLHDLGKLAVSKSILNKPAALNSEEYNVIRSHTFYTYRLLQKIRGFETINQWASFHHEKLNGKGYPFHLEDSDIPLGSRIMAVADIFTAITEDRPYRAGLPAGRVRAILQSMVKDHSLCPYVVSLLMENFDMINQARQKAQRRASADYRYITEPDSHIRKEK